MDKLQMFYFFPNSIFKKYTFLDKISINKSNQFGQMELSQSSKALINISNNEIPCSDMGVTVEKAQKHTNMHSKKLYSSFLFCECHHQWSQYLVAVTAHCMLWNLHHLKIFIAFSSSSLIHIVSLNSHSD